MLQKALFAAGALLVTVCASGCTEPPAIRLADDTPMVLIPAGEFLMGSDKTDRNVYPHEKDKEQPQHPVFVDAFYMDAREVTHKAFERLYPRHERSKLYPTCDDCPVTEVTWHEAKAYCEAFDPPKRLPTEAEWEKAAKGGAAFDPIRLIAMAWTSENAADGPKPVGTREPNGYGLYDMLGNVREWTADWYDPGYYQKGVRDNPKGPETGESKVERGGAFFLPRKGVTSTIRYHHPPDFRLYFLGFRCVRDAEPGATPTS